MMMMMMKKIAYGPAFLGYAQWLKCNGTQGNAVPHLQFMAQSVPQPQIVIMLGKGTCTTSVRGPNLNVAFPHL